MGSDRRTELMEGGLDVNIQDQTTQIVELHFTKSIQSAVLTVALEIDDTTITVTTVGTPIAGRMICIKEGQRYYQGEILSVVANASDWDLALDAPLDYAFTVEANASEELFNLNVDGSSTPQIFKITPTGLNADVEFDITRILFNMTDQTSMDDAKFGGITALTKGLLLRIKNGITKNIFVAKSNGDLKSHMYDVSYSDKAPSGFFGIAGRKTFAGQSKSGVVIRLKAEDSDELQIIVQDNLTGLDTISFIANGHYVEGETQ